MGAAARRAPAQDQLAHSLIESVTVLSKYLRNVKLPDGMTRERLTSLTAIKEHEPISVSDLATIARVKVPTMSRMVSSLVADGLAKRAALKTDGRGVLISLTAKGRRACQKANEQTLRYLADVLGNLSAQQVAALTALTDSLDSLKSSVADE